MQEKITVLRQEGMEVNLAKCSYSYYSVNKGYFNVIFGNIFLRYFIYIYF